jgi:hypothetical protein
MESACETPAKWWLRCLINVSNTIGVVAGRPVDGVGV